MKRPYFPGKSWFLAALAMGALSASAWRADAAPYIQTDLVSDIPIPGVATIVDPTLVNPWGISHSSGSPFWISNQGTNTTNLWTVTGQTNVTKVTAVNPPTGNIAIPTTASGPQGPTGQVNNGNMSSFLVGNGGDNKFAHFIFANLNGTISAWDTGPTAFIQPSATTPGAVFTGLAINTAQTMLYAANDAGGGSVKVFDSSFAPVNLGANAFKDPAVGALVPFNVQDINGHVYVAYAPATNGADRTPQTHAPLGAGAVAIFDESGTLLQTLINGSQLAAPWGIALAPAGFGPFGGDLLVGNFSYDHSEINAFDPTSGALLGTIPVNDGGIGAGGLWALNFGIGGNNGDPNTLYITDGIGGENHGLFAAFTVAAVPEPSGLALLATAFALFGVCCARRRPQI
ncbi:MAG: TIGR03118 family protein [Alphaproteobacteria bacterium]|nr:TIGR03118 family protein [Alphaproteobacteria bacterium]